MPARKAIKRIFNCLPSQNTDGDWTFDDAVAALAATPPTPIPPSKDLREPWWAIGDQGATGSCVGWATDGKLAVCTSNTADGGHAVTLVGYTRTDFMVRNSRGTELWGDKGFGYATLAYARAAFTEAYGISV